MPGSDFSDHPTIQALDAAIDALTYLREGGTKMVSVSPEVWKQFIAPPATTAPATSTPQPTPTATTAQMPSIPAPSRATHAAISSTGGTPENHTQAHQELSTLITRCSDCAYASETHYLGHGNTYHPKVLVVNGACLSGDTPMAVGSRLEGDAGALLRKMFASIHLSEDDLYITSSLKCPVTGRPDSKCLQMCINHLHKEIQLVHPDAIVMLGDVAAKAVIPRSIAATGKVGLWHLFADQIPAIKLHHPMQILRLAPELAQPLKMENWNALRSLRDRLNAPSTPTL